MALDVRTVRTLKILPKAASQSSRPKQLTLDLNKQIIVDLFAGGGGVSVGMEMAWGRSPDIAVNHNEAAINMHRMNHPQTRHFISDVFEVDPHAATQDRVVGWLHLSPDCTHFSQSSAGQPREAKIRGLSWVGKRWAAQVRPVCISLENVKQIQQWGPLIAKRDPMTGRVLQRTTLYWKTKRGVKKTDTWRPAEKGERVPIHDQFLTPDPKRIGQTWRKFIRELEALGYHVESKLLVAASLGGHTTRERLLMMARCDGEPIIWPQASNFKKPTEGQARWKPVHECLDFSIPCPSIFSRKKPLATNTNRRLAKGIGKFVLENAEPFIVPIAHYNGQDHAQSSCEPLRTIKAATKGGEFALCAPALVAATHHGGDRIYGPSDAGPTITGANRGEIMMCAPTLIKYYSEGGQWSNADAPMDAATTRARMSLATAYLMQANDGFNVTVGREVTEPISAIQASGSQQQLVTAFLSSYYTDEANRCRLLDQAAATITTENRLGLIECTLSSSDIAGALRVADFLIEYSQGKQWDDARVQRASLTVEEMLALVTVFVKGVAYVIVDIGLRMLVPRELYNAQDFPPDYIIDRGADGRNFTITEQVRMVGNSVDPLMVKDLFRLNAPHLAVRKVA